MSEEIISVSNSEVNPEHEVPNQQEEEPVMSKNQKKRLMKLEKKASLRQIKRKQERERKKQERKINLCIKETTNGEIVTLKRKELKHNRIENSSNKLRVVIDCSFESMMNESDTHHLCKQLSYCYARNRRMDAPLQFYITSCSKESKTLNHLNKSGVLNWDVHLKEEFYLDVFSMESKENIVYLTSDSPNEIDEFDEKKVYIIGGFVDHNHHKSYCYDLAVKHGISHAQLPISKYMHMKTRQVLTVNQVFEIISRFVECKDWKQAFIATLPKRKGAEAKEEIKNESNEDSNKQE